MKISTVILLALIGSWASAQELNLVCIREGSGGSYEVRQVLIGDNQEQTTQLSDSSGRVRHLRKFAIVIELIPGLGMQPATESWRVLGSSEFRLRSGVQGFPFVFRDIQERKTYDCDYNNEVRANPAIIRIN